MSEAEQAERKKIGKIELSNNYDIIASMVDDKKFELSVADKVNNKKLELTIVDNSAKDKEDAGWLFPSLVSVSGWLARTTVYGWIRAHCPKAKNRRNADIWVLGNFVVSIILWIIMSYVGHVGHMGWLIVGCSIWRIYGSVVIQTDTALFAAEQAKRKGTTQKPYSPERSVVYALITYIGLSFWFAILYMKFHCLFGGPHIKLSSLSGSWYFSVATMSTLGYGNIFPTTGWGQFIAICQTMIGILFAIIIVGRFLSWMKRPEVNSK